MGIKQAFTSIGNPKRNADTEAIDRWMPRFNQMYRHSALGYKTPNAFDNRHAAGPVTLVSAG